MNFDRKIQRINRQWDFIIKSEGGFSVSIELTDHWGCFENTPFIGHTILYGKVFPQDFNDLLQDAIDWGDDLDKELIEWVKGRGK
jgi:hypothetical protein